MTSTTQKQAGLTLDNAGQFVTVEGKQLGIFAHKKVSRGRARYQYRDASGALYASGMGPGEFVKSFWFRDDFDQAAL